MLKSRRSSTPSGGSKGSEGAKDRPSRIPKKVSTSSLQQHNHKEEKTGKQVLASRKHHSTSSVPQKIQHFEFASNKNAQNNELNKKKDVSASTVVAKKKWWDSVVESVFISDFNEVKLHFELCGGADEGQFPHIGPINVSDLTKIGLHVSGGLIQEGDVLLEIQGQKVSGYTAADVSRWFKHCLQNKNPVVVRTVPKGRKHFDYHMQKTFTCQLTWIS